MDLLIRIPIDLEESEHTDPETIKAVAQAWLDGSITNAMRNPMIDDIGSMLGEGLAAVGIFASETEDMIVTVTDA